MILFSFLLSFLVIVHSINVADTHLIAAKWLSENGQKESEKTIEIRAGFWFELIEKGKINEFNFIALKINLQ